MPATRTSGRSSATSPPSPASPRIDELFAVANDTHQNFYEDRYSLTQLARRHEQVSALLELLDEAQRTMPPDLPMPADRHYRRRHNLTAANRS